MDAEELLALEYESTGSARNYLMDRLNQWRTNEISMIGDAALSGNCTCELSDDYPDHEDNCTGAPQELSSDDRFKIATIDSAYQRISEFCQAKGTFAKLINAARKELGYVMIPNRQDVVAEIRVPIDMSKLVLVVYADGKNAWISWKLILSALINRKAGEGVCGFCGVKHSQYGLEAEVMTMFGDNLYRDVLLRKLNKKLHINHSKDRFGVDGSGDPLEIRDINGDSIRKIVGSYSLALDKLLDGQKFMIKNFPYVSKDISTINCGIHIHQFHEKVSREILTTAHSLVGMLVNSIEPDTWGTRTRHGYGAPMNFRMPTPWCENPESATELRVFNVLHPKTLECSMEVTEELSKKIKNSFTPAHLDEFVRSKKLVMQNVPDQDTFNKVLSFFVEKEVVTPEEIKVIYKRIKDSYIPVLGKKKNMESKVTIDERIIGFRPTKVKKVIRKKEHRKSFDITVPVNDLDWVAFEEHSEAEVAQ